MTLLFVRLTLVQIHLVNEQLSLDDQKRYQFSIRHLMILTFFVAMCSAFTAMLTRNGAISIRDLADLVILISAVTCGNIGGFAV